MMEYLLNTSRNSRVLAVPLECELLPSDRLTGSDPILVHSGLLLVRRQLTHEIRFASFPRRFCGQLTRSVRNGCRAAD